MVKYDRIKVQLVRPEERISAYSDDKYREVRLVTMTAGEGVRVDYFDGGIEWFPVNSLVYVLGRH